MRRTADTVYIKTQLLRAGMTVTDLAGEAGYSRVHVSETIHGKRRAERSQRRVAGVLGIPMAKAFPRRTR